MYNLSWTIRGDLFRALKSELILFTANKLIWRLTHCLYVLCLVQRSEALQAALAKRFTAQAEPELPAPFKRPSMIKRKPAENGTQSQIQRGICPKLHVIT